VNDTATGAGVIEFGPGGAYLGYISDPSHLRSQTAAILFGFGRLEGRIARSLAALGLIVMQIRLVKDYADLKRRLRFYDDSGVPACMHAIDAIVSQRRVTQVVLIGDCAEANVSFNTALVDPRVVGLILSNPNANPTLTFVDRLPHRLFSLAEWRRLLAGNSKLVKSLLHRLGSSAAEQWLAAHLPYRKDVVLPLDFDQKLSSLHQQRAVRSLLLFSRDRLSLRHFRKAYGATLDQLAASGRLAFDVLATDAHDPSADDAAVRQFAEVTAQWAAEAFAGRASRRIETQLPQQASALADSVTQASIVQTFEAIARLYPDRLAVRDEARSLTYAELARQSRRIASAIAAAAVESGPVAVLLGHEARFPAAMLGVWEAARACVPLDADHPADRNARIAAHAGATIVITTAELATNARAMFPSGLCVIDLDALDELDGLHEPGAGDSPPPAAAPRPDDIACVIYTSGSTGAPKGVFQNHRGLLQDIQESVSFAQICRQDRIALLYPPSVIAGLRTLFTGLASGASLEVLPPRIFGRTALAGQIKARGITLLRLSPTLFRHLADTLTAGACFEDVRLVTLGGERVDWSDFDVFRRACPPHADLVVHLGATECWTLHTEWKVDPALRATCPRLPVGRAVLGKRLDIVGDGGQTLPEGEVGEAVVTSRYIALGYWRDPELTAEFFTVDPADPLQRSYRTGDLVRRRADGLVEFVGRKDNQIKLHGYRIEPNEIEAALKSCAGVKDAAVLVRKDAAGVPLALAAYVQLQANVSTDHIQAELGERVPPHMMPAEIGVLDELPWLPNFKIDRQRLARIDAERSSQRSRTESSPLISELIETFEQVTKASGATPTDNILSLGGDSLQALELMLEISRRFRVVVPEQAQDPTRTISQWARDISAWRSPDAARWTG
jgi:amino acid adenylation domain-containing protein